MPSNEQDYPQLPPLTEEGLLSRYQQTIFARLGTINEDGTVHISPIYFKYKDSQIVMASQVRSRKIRNIKRNNKVSVLIDVTEPVYKGALIYGEAELDHENVITKRAEIFMRFMSKEESQEDAEGLCNRWESVIVRLTPSSIASFDYSQDWPLGCSRKV